MLMFSLYDREINWIIKCLLCIMWDKEKFDWIEYKDRCVLVDAWRLIMSLC